MEKTRTLPPLVRGRVRAVLGVFIDEISAINTSVLMDTFDLIVQIQWWGEDSPIYLRPKKAPFQHGRIRGKLDSVDMAKYEIKTTLELFKLYLKSCEVLELCVLDVLKRSIIGSAFLRDLVNFLNQSNNFISAPLFDHSGEKIGQVTICFSFLDKFHKIETKKNKEICTLKSNHKDQLGKLNSKSLNTTKKSCYNSTKNSVFTNCCEDINFSEITPEKFDTKKREKIANTKTSDSFKGIKSIYIHNEEVPNSVPSCKCLPKITISRDSSRILYFGLSLQKNEQKISKRSSDMRNKLNSSSMRSKSNSKSLENLSSFSSIENISTGQMITKRPANEVVQSSEKKGTVEVRESVYNCLQNSNHDQSLIKDIPSKHSAEKKVLDFLLGANLSKEDEESAVNEFKKMSPSHNLVMSLNQLCLASDSNDSHNSGNKHGIDLSASPSQSSLVFDLNNSIERNYYEKFFLESKCLPDFELAEFLNQPENSADLERLKSRENINNKDGAQVNSFKKGEPSLVEKREGPTCRENFPKHFNDNDKGCARCKYYKKLDELDKIIESLKHFETKMLLHEKGLEWPLIENSGKYFTSQLNSS